MKGSTLFSLTTTKSVILMVAVITTTSMAAKQVRSDVLSSTKWQLSGLMQGRASYSDGTTGSTGVSDDLSVRRAELSVLATVDEHTSACVTLECATSTFLLEGFAQYKWTNEKVRLGLNAVPFGYENPLGSSKLITLERSQVTQILLEPKMQFDRGLFYYTSVGNANLGIGLVNGASVTTGNDGNRKKNTVARIGYALKDGEIGASVYDGSDDVTNATMNRKGFDLYFGVQSTTLIGEYIEGKDGMIKSKGGYLTIAYRKSDSEIQIFGRYDQFDPDTNQSTDNFKRFTCGVNRYLNDYTKFTLQYENIDDKLSPGLNGKFSTQLQVSF